MLLAYYPPKKSPRIRALLKLVGQGRARSKTRKTRGPEKTLGGYPPCSFTSPWSCWPSFWLFPGPPGLHRICLRKALLKSPQKAKAQLIRCHPAQAQLLETIHNSTSVTKQLDQCHAIQRGTTHMEHFSLAVRSCSQTMLEPTGWFRKALEPLLRAPERVLVH